MLPDSGFIHTVQHGKRTQKTADKFISNIKAHSDGEAPLFLSDGWSSYEEILEKYYGHDESLKYAQIIKHKTNGRLTQIETRILRGDEQEILDIIQAGGRAHTINTSYVESRNGNYRKDNKRLTRRTQCHSKKVKLHDAHIDWITAVYNFVNPNQAWRECINPRAQRFETKYQQQSPAMIEGLLDRMPTMEELLMMKFPSS